VPGIGGVVVMAGQAAQIARLLMSRRAWTAICRSSWGGHDFDMFISI